MAGNNISNIVPPCPWFNAPPVQPIDLFSYAINGPVTTFFVVIGCLWNVICVTIFLKPLNPRPYLYLFLVTLAFWDTALLCSAFLLYGLPTLLYGRPPFISPYVKLYPATYALGNMTLTASLWTLMTLSIGRYIALCYPLWHKVVVRKANIKKVLLVVSILAVLYTLPRFFELKLNAFCSDRATGVINTVVVQTNLRENHAYQIGYKIVGGILLNSAVPFAILIFLTARIIVEVRRSNLRCNALGNVSRSLRAVDRSNNALFIAVVVKFLLCHALPTVLDAVEHFEHKPVGPSLVNISNFLVVFNSATNSCVYFVWGPRFRAACSSLFCRKTQRRTDMMTMLTLPRESNTNYDDNSTFVSPVVTPRGRHRFHNFEQEILIPMRETLI